MLRGNSLTFETLQRSKNNGFVMFHYWGSELRHPPEVLILEEHCGVTAIQICREVVRSCGPKTSADTLFVFWYQSYVLFYCVCL